MTTATYIDTLCQGCGHRLRVAAEHAGKKARCPRCQAVYVIPQQSTVSSAGVELPVPATPTEQSWQMKSPEGLVFGPVSKADLDAWRDQGRITIRSQLLPTGGQRWLWASEVYPDLAPPAEMTPVSQPAALIAGRPAGPTLHSYYASGIEPHRGVLVLVASILGITTACAVPSLIAVILGCYDLRRMKTGKMDPTGRKMTIVGIVLGSIWTILSIGVLVLILIAWLAS